VKNHPLSTNLKEVTGKCKKGKRVGANRDFNLNRMTHKELWEKKTAAARENPTESHCKEIDVGETGCPVESVKGRDFNGVKITLA